MKLPSTHHLRAFEASGRHLSFKRAAEELGITPSAISHQIKAMEDRLGTPLFKRSNRDVALTEVGQEYWIAVHSTFENLRHETNRLFGAGDAPLRILCSRSFLRNRLLQRIPEFFELHPNIRLELPTFDKNTSTQFDANPVSAWIRLGNGKWAGRRSVQVMSIETFPMCSPGYLARRPKVVEPSDLRHHQLIYTTARRREWEDWFESVGLPKTLPHDVLQLEGETLDYEAAIAGLGIAMGRRGFCEAEFTDGRLVPVLDIVLRRPESYFLSYPVAFEADPRLIAFKNWLSSWAITD